MRGDNLCDPVTCALLLFLISPRGSRFFFSLPRSLPGSSPARVSCSRACPLSIVCFYHICSLLSCTCVHDTLQLASPRPFFSFIRTRFFFQILFLPCPFFARNCVVALGATYFDQTSLVICFPRIFFHQILFFLLSSFLLQAYKIFSVLLCSSLRFLFAFFFFLLSFALFAFSKFQLKEKKPKFSHLNPLGP